MTLLITKVGAPTTHTHTLKDGSGKTFTKTEVPVTLQAKFGEETGFTVGVNYTLWLDAGRAAKVIAIAQAFIDGEATDSAGELYHSNNRLAISNDVECFNLGELRTKELTNKFGGTYTVTNQTLWLKDDLALTYDIAELAVSPQRGNIDDLDIAIDVRGTALLATAVVPSVSTMDEPF
jgi:hypothetical protein